jgi:alpha-ketoglutarate-dependent taurine dioxygenase
MVWLNPVTGEKCFQIMAEIVRKVYFKDAQHKAERIVEDEEEIRVWLNRIFDRLARPEYIMIPRTEEGDMVVWNNWVLS